MTLSQIKEILDRVSFAPSCLDMGWQWEVTHVMDTDIERCIGDGYLIRTTFQRPDTLTGQNGIGKGRWWFVAENISESGLVKTAWLACKQIVEHELMEAFLYNGIRPFDPHMDIQDLCDNALFTRAKRR